MQYKHILIIESLEIEVLRRSYLMPTGNRVENKFYYLNTKIISCSHCFVAIGWNMHKHYNLIISSINITMSIIFKKKKNFS